MSIIRSLSLLCVGLSLSCVATSVRLVEPKQEYISEPNVGDVRTSDVGETLVRGGYVLRRPAYVLREEYILSQAGLKVWFPPGQYSLKYEGAEWMCYQAPEPVRFKSLGRGENQFCICESRIQTGNYAFYVANWGGNPAAIKGNPPQLTASQAVETAAAEAEQELIYNGKAGQVVRFLYRESIGGMARPAFDQAVQYDLSEGTTIGFKGCRIEVLEATNTSIRYRVIAHFPSPLAAS